jgi:uncharacterized protein (TIGR02266 family)
MKNLQTKTDERRNELRHQVFVKTMASFGSHVDNRAMTRDVSRTGVAITTSQVVPEGFPVELRFQLPGTSRPIFTRGVVRWTDKRQAAQPGELPGFGVEFTDLDDRARLELDRFLQDR